MSRGTRAKRTKCLFLEISASLYKSAAITFPASGRRIDRSFLFYQAQIFCGYKKK
jgi:hypothetical protein